MQGEADNLRWYVLAFVGLLTALGGIIGTPLALIRVWTTERQTKTAEQSHIAEVLAKAGENLGAEKTVKRVNADGEAIEKSVPALEVRSLGLLALERLARETPDYHIQVMEIISAYIRHNAESYAAHKQNFGGDQRHRLRDDLETALRILMRRKVGQISREKASDFKVSLANTSFMGLTLVELGFPNVDLKNTNLSHAELTSIDFRDTWLSMTDFSNSKISDVQFPTFWSPFGSFHEAVLTRCTLPLHIFWLHGLSCDKARFLSCEFSHTSPEPHKVISGASSPSSALFVDCKFPPNFFGVKNSNVFVGNGFFDCDLSKTSISQEHVDTSFGERNSVILPEGVSYPKHWPETINERSFTPFQPGHSEYKIWIEWLKGHDRA